MSLVYNKDNREYHINLKLGDVGKYVLLPGAPERCEKIASYFDNPVKIMQNREYTTYTGYILDEKVSVVSTGIGGASAAIALEELVHIGADTFIRVGTSGGMAENVKAGDLVVATGAIRLDGTSKEYAPIEYPAVADFEVTNALYDAARKTDTDVHIGVVQCKDSFYGQHNPESMPIFKTLEDNWNAYIECGALTSEMESATLFIVGGIRRVRVGSILLVVGNQERRKRGVPENLCDDTDIAIKSAVEALRILIEKDRLNGRL